MKSDFKTKLIQHILNKKNGEKGFTLIELLVVIIIIGILAAIALPSFLNQANKAKESEAKSYVGAVNRGQQAYYLERNKFTTQIGSLALGITTNTANYFYELSTSGTSGTASGTNYTAGTVGSDVSTHMNAYGIPSNSGILKGFAGTAYYGSTGSENTTRAILCVNQGPGNPTGFAGAPTATTCASTAMTNLL